jgi:hypothetical protein
MRLSPAAPTSIQWVLQKADGVVHARFAPFIEASRKQRVEAGSQAAARRPAINGVIPGEDEAFRRNEDTYAFKTTPAVAGMVETIAVIDDDPSLRVVVPPGVVPSRPLDALTVAEKRALRDQGNHIVPLGQLSAQLRKDDVETRRELDLVHQVFAAFPRGVDATSAMVHPWEGRQHLISRTQLVAPASGVPDLPLVGTGQLNAGVTGAVRPGCSASGRRLPSALLAAIERKKGSAATSPTATDSGRLGLYGPPSVVAAALAAEEGDEAGAASASRLLAQQAGSLASAVTGAADAEEAKAAAARAAQAAAAARVARAQGEPVNVFREVLLRSVAKLPGFLMGLVFPAIVSRYRPDGTPRPHDLAMKIEAVLTHLPQGRPGTQAAPGMGLPPEDRARYIADITAAEAPLGLPSPPAMVVTRAMFLRWFEDEMAGRPDPDRLFNSLRMWRGREFLLPVDFQRCVCVLLDVHPGLEFLRQTPEFQQKYADTVVVRIFHGLDTTEEDRISRLQLRRSNFLDVCREVDQEEDINRVLRYFSYEHFYVLYVKFWELDADHDQLLALDDLLKFGSYSLSFRCGERIFQQVARPFRSLNTPTDNRGFPLEPAIAPRREARPRMGYEDFVWFLLCSEDEDCPAALRYWFRVADLDSDGFVTETDFEYFFAEQAERLANMGQEAVRLHDVRCQMFDMLRIARSRPITMSDVANSGMQGNLFNVLFNLNKFLQFEQRDPYTVHYNDAYSSMWDRFARSAYDCLSQDDALAE